MNVFLDTSALFKLYHREPFSDELKHFLYKETGLSTLIISRLGIVEITSAAWNKERSSSPDFKPIATTILLHFNTDLGLGHFVVAEMDRNCHEMAVTVLNKCNEAGYSLRSLDALQLASFLQLNTAVEVFITCDRHLTAAARYLGIHTEYFGPPLSPNALSAS